MDDLKQMGLVNKKSDSGPLMLEGIPTNEPVKQNVESNMEDQFDFNALGGGAGKRRSRRKTMRGGNNTSKEQM